MDRSSQQAPFIAPPLVLAKQIANFKLFSSHFGEPRHPDNASMGSAVVVNLDVINSCRIRGISRSYPWPRPSFSGRTKIVSEIGFHSYLPIQRSPYSDREPFSTEHYL